MNDDVYKIEEFLSIAKNYAMDGKKEFTPFFSFNQNQMNTIIAMKENGLRGVESISRAISPYSIARIDPSFKCDYTFFIDNLENFYAAANL